VDVSYQLSSVLDHTMGILAKSLDVMHAGFQSLQSSLKEQTVQATEALTLCQQAKDQEAMHRLQKEDLKQLVINTQRRTGFI
jgi:vancomycin permeability regulator SanA